MSRGAGDDFIHFKLAVVTLALAAAMEVALRKLTVYVELLHAYLSPTADKFSYKSSFQVTFSTKTTSLVLYRNELCEAP